MIIKYIHVIHGIVTYALFIKNCSEGLRDCHFALAVTAAFLSFDSCCLQVLLTVSLA